MAFQIPNGSASIKHFVIVLALLGLTACGSDDSSDAAAVTPTGVTQQDNEDLPIQPVPETLESPVPDPAPVLPPPPLSLPVFNSPAVISGVNSGVVIEDVDPDGDGLLEASGALTITDADAGEAAFIAAVSSGSLGSLTIDTTGNWSYAASNNQQGIQGLITGGSVSESFTVSSAGGATHMISIRIDGADDPTIIGGVDSGAVIEDIDPDGDGLLETSGALTITDPDAGEGIIVQHAAAGLYGSLVIDSRGVWNYSANNSLATIQNLNSGESISESFTVESITGSTHTISITVAGVDETPVLAAINLSWVAPVEREDGTPIAMSEIAGYRVYYGPGPNDYTNQVDVSGSSNTQATIDNLLPGTYYVAVTTIDTDGRESGYSGFVVGNL